MRLISAPLNRKDHQSLCEAVSEAAAKWRDVGEALKFSYDELGLIASERSLRKDEHYMQELLSRWLKRAPPNHPLPRHVWKTLLLHCVQLGRKELPMTL